MRNFLFAVVVAVFGFAAVNAGEKGQAAKAEAVKAEPAKTALVPLTAREKRHLEIFKEVKVTELVTKEPTVVARRGLRLRRTSTSCCE
jgi:hypothetical protein